jgi:hypothetical protein
VSNVSDVNRNMVMRHPEITGVATTTVAAYNNLWRAKGWEPVTTKEIREMDREELFRLAETYGVVLTGDESGDEAAQVFVDAGVLPPAALPDNLNSLKKDELMAMAAERHLAVPSDVRKDELIETLEAQEAVDNG